MSAPNKESPAAGPAGSDPGSGGPAVPASPSSRQCVLCGVRERKVFGILKDRVSACRGCTSLLCKRCLSAGGTCPVRLPDAAQPVRVCPKCCIANGGLPTAATKFDWARARIDPGSGSTALHLAAVRDDPTQVEHLLKVIGGDPCVQDNEGRLPVDLAGERCRELIAGATQLVSPEKGGGNAGSGGGGGGGGNSGGVSPVESRSPVISAANSNNQNSSNSNNQVSLDDLGDDSDETDGDDDNHDGSASPSSASKRHNASAEASSSPSQSASSSSASKSASPSSSSPAAGSRTIPTSPSLLELPAAAADADAVSESDANTGEAAESGSAATNSQQSKKGRSQSEAPKQPETHPPSQQQQQKEQKEQPQRKQSKEQQPKQSKEQKQSQDKQQKQSKEKQQQPQSQDKQQQPSSSSSSSSSSPALRKSSSSAQIAVSGRVSKGSRSSSVTAANAKQPKETGETRHRKTSSRSRNSSTAKQSPSTPSLTSSDNNKRSQNSNTTPQSPPASPPPPPLAQGMSATPVASTAIVPVGVDIATVAQLLLLLSDPEHCASYPDFRAVFFQNLPCFTVPTVVLRQLEEAFDQPLAVYERRLKRREPRNRALGNMLRTKIHTVETLIGWATCFYEEDLAPILERFSSASGLSSADTASGSSRIDEDGLLEASAFLKTVQDPFEWEDPKIAASLGSYAPMLERLHSLQRELALCIKREQLRLRELGGPAASHRPLEEFLYTIRTNNPDLFITGTSSTSAPASATATSPGSGPSSGPASGASSPGGPAASTGSSSSLCATMLGVRLGEPTDSSSSSGSQNSPDFHHSAHELDTGDDGSGNGASSGSGGGGGSGVNLLDFPLEQVARQITLLDHFFLKQIRRRAFIRKEWTRKHTAPQKAPGILAMIELFNRRSFWVATVVLTVADHAKRVQALKKLLSLCLILVEQGNWYAAFAVVTGLQMTPVHRLKADWDGVGTKLITRWEKLLRGPLARSRNFQLHRRAFEAWLRKRKPSIPHLAMALNDLYQTEERIKVFAEDEQPVQQQAAAVEAEDDSRGGPKEDDNLTDGDEDQDNESETSDSSDVGDEIDDGRGGDYSDGRDDGGVDAHGSAEAKPADRAKNKAQGVSQDDSQGASHTQEASGDTSDHRGSRGGHENSQMGGGSAVLRISVDAPPVGDESAAAVPTEAVPSYESASPSSGSSSGSCEPREPCEPCESPVSGPETPSSPEPASPSAETGPGPASEPVSETASLGEPDFLSDDPDQPEAGATELTADLDSDGAAEETSVVSLVSTVSLASPRASLGSAEETTGRRGSVSSSVGPPSRIPSEAESQLEESQLESQVGGDAHHESQRESKRESKRGSSKHESKNGSQQQLQKPGDTADASGAGESDSAADDDHNDDDDLDAQSDPDHDRDSMNDRGDGNEASVSRSSKNRQSTHSRANNNSSSGSSSGAGNSHLRLGEHETYGLLSSPKLPHSPPAFGSTGSGGLGAYDAAVLASQITSREWLAYSSGEGSSSESADDQGSDDPYFRRRHHHHHLTPGRVRGRRNRSVRSSDDEYLPPPSDSDDDGGASGMGSGGGVGGHSGGSRFGGFGTTGGRGKKRNDSEDDAKEAELERQRLKQAARDAQVRQAAARSGPRVNFFKFALQWKIVEPFLVCQRRYFPYHEDWRLLGILIKDFQRTIMDEHRLFQLSYRYEAVSKVSEYSLNWSRASWDEKMTMVTEASLTLSEARQPIVEARRRRLEAELKIRASEDAQLAELQDVLDKLALWLRQDQQEQQNAGDFPASAPRPASASSSAESQAKSKDSKKANQPEDKQAGAVWIESAVDLIQKQRRQIQQMAEDMWP